MTARERALQGLGGRCAWCGRTQDLEFDHVEGGQGQGNRHRLTLKQTKIYYWVLDQFAKDKRWPTSVQLLCTRCHDKKSGRLPMSAGRGQKALNINLPDALAAQLAVLAAGPDHHTKSGVIEAALRAYLEGSAQQTVLDQVHRRLDTLTQAVKELTQHLAQPVPVPKALEDRLEMLERQQRQQTADLTRLLQGIHTDLKAVSDALTGRLEPTTKGWFGR
jgi:5-methylcytosine-specific restriction endonuclease McrA